MRKFFTVKLRSDNASTHQHEFTFDLKSIEAVGPVFAEHTKTHFTVYTKKYEIMLGHTCQGGYDRLERLEVLNEVNDVRASIILNLSDACKG